MNKPEQETHDRRVRTEFFNAVPSMKQEKRVLLQHAYDEAFIRHAGQTRDDGSPYFEGHVLPVARTLLRFGYNKASALIIALLHDTPEDSWMQLSLIERLFGHKIARRVAALSKSYNLEDPISGCATRTSKKPLDEYHKTIAAGRTVGLVKIADRLHNLSDLINPPPGSRWTNVKRENYLQETETYILPLALALDPRMAEEMKRLIAEIRANIQVRILQAQLAAPSA
jgi:(p)ppGpp synthase/HD superfamily hydrolase